MGVFLLLVMYYITCGKRVVNNEAEYAGQEIRRIIFLAAGQACRTVYSDLILNREDTSREDPNLCMRGFPPRGTLLAKVGPAFATNGLKSSNYKFKM